MYAGMVTASALIGLLVGILVGLTGIGRGLLLLHYSRCLSQGALERYPGYAADLIWTVGTDIVHGVRASSARLWARWEQECTGWVCTALTDRIAQSAGI